ncbi:ATP-binding protein [Desulfocastanea catecholica]
MCRRYEKGSFVITSNRAYKNWPEIFNYDATLTSASLKQGSSSRRHRR